MIYIKKFIRYLIYKNYNWQVKVNSRFPASATAAALGFTCVMLFLAIIYSFDIVYDLYIEFGIIAIMVVIVYFWVTISVTKYICSYGMDNIIKECKANTKLKEHLGSFLILTFNILAIISPLIAAAILFRDRAFW